MKKSKLITGPWKLSQINSIEKNGLKVFSCFHCGGGSSMGYKLAGFEVLGGVEIDPKMMELYRTNHNPKHSFLMGVEEFNKIQDKDIPKELFNLDVLDGSPPCSSFSMAGSREDAWGKEKKFREGQAKQVLDDLFFHFIATANKLKPKVVIAENVKGLVIGNARGYVKQIFQGFDKVGYDVQLFLLNASRMGVPQARERTFFIARRKDLELPPIKLEFNEPVMGVAKAIEGAGGTRKTLSEAFAKWWRRVPPGSPFSDAHPKKSFFSCKKLHPDKPSLTLTSTNASSLTLWNEPTSFSSQELIRIQTFPGDYNFLDLETSYVCGMSVPPFMMQRVADQIYTQWLSKLKTKKGPQDKPKAPALTGGRA